MVLDYSDARTHRSTANYNGFSFFAKEIISRSADTSLIKTESAGKYQRITYVQYR